VKKRRVVITGLGIVAPNGIGKDAFWNACVSGRSGVDMIMSFDTSQMSSKIAAQILDFDPLDFVSRKVVKRTDRFVHFGLASAFMALEDSGLKISASNRDRIGVCIGSVFGGVLFHEAQMIVGLEKGFNRINPLSVPRVSTNAVSSHIAIELNITGPNLSISTACASGSNAIGQAFKLIQRGEAEVIFSGGVESPLSPFTFSAFCNLQLLSRRNEEPSKACRPFDRDRDGFVLGEGGAILLMEELSHAIRRNARIYGEIVGYAGNCGSYHTVLPDVDGEETARVMQRALNDGDSDPLEIDYISAYGNATQLYDQAETNSIKRLFGKRAYNIPVSSVKSMIGHTVGASGAIEAVSCILALQNNVIPPTINYENPDPDCDLDYVPNKARKARLNTVMLNSFGAGNHNTSIVMRRFIDRRRMN
jgi:3-oxoacyl-[acyl-carrier-protein] synthase II